jgi:oxygen-dependent protoporphyrinogen oxidase
VVGGGLSGLVAALELADQGAAVTLVEAGPRLGGQIATARCDGFVVEQGAEGFVARSTAVPDLCRRLGLGERLVGQLAHDVLLARGDGTCRQLGPGEAAGRLGIQADPEDLGKGLLTLRRGMGALVEALAGRLQSRVELRLDRRVRSLRPVGAGWRVESEDGLAAAGDAVVLAVPPAVVADLLEPLLARPLPPLDLRFDSLVTVSLAVGGEGLARRPGATGVVVEGNGWDGLRAVTFCSRKFPDRAPAGWELLRAFLAPRPTERDIGDPAWVERTTRLVARVTRGELAPTRARVDRWWDTIPRYGPSHRASVAAWREAAASLGPIGLAGAAFDRLGVDGAVRSGLAAARSATTCASPD